MNKVSGLSNYGATCYFNSTIQALVSSRKLGEQGVFPSEFKSPADVKPLLDSFVSKFPKYNLGSPHDAHECLLDIIESLDKEPKKLFYGKNEQHFTTPDGTTVQKSDFSTVVMHPNGQSLEELFDQMSNTQIIGQYEKYQVVAMKTVYCELPEILVFLFSGGGDVKLPLKFKERDLVAVVFHLGSANGGHYVAQVKRGDVWFLVDDDRVIQVDNVSELNCPASFAIYSD
jgi:ubiquitin C-terminal hydrolase